MSTLDIDSIDKTHFICFELKDESVYFGEVQYLDEQGKLHNPRENAEAKTLGKPLRHGFGIQLFGTTAENFVCKYEGYWQRDRQHGLCRCFYPDKAVYEGNMKLGVKEGYGKFTWPNGDFYEGNWKNNRFEGGGYFTHHDGTVLKGIFKNNYYVMEGDVFLNPFLQKSEEEEFLKRRHEINVLKEKNKKQKLFFFERTGEARQLAELIRKSNHNARIPIVFSSKESDKHVGEIFSEVASSLQKKWGDFDLRRAAEAEKEEKHREYLREVKLHLSDALALGDVFVVNLDDSDSNYEEIYYPDIREFYNAQSFPQQIWNLEEVRKFQVYEKVFAETKNQLKIGVVEDLTIAVWTKYKLDEALEDKRIIEKIERRLSSILPMIKLDFIMFTTSGVQLPGASNVQGAAADDNK